MTLEYKIINVTAGEKLSAICRTEHCLTNKNMRPIRTQKEFPDIFRVFNEALEET